MFKKNVISLILCSVVLGSCSQQEPVQIQQVEDYALPDAIGVMQGTQAYFTDGTAYYFPGVPVYLMIYIVGGALDGSTRAATFDNKNKMYSPHVSPDLPSTYLLSTNPFEDIGIMHNRGLNLTVNLGGLDSMEHKFLNYDSLFYNNFCLTSTDSNINSTANRKKIFDTVRINDYGAQLKTIIDNNTITISTEEDMWGSLSWLDSDTYNYVKATYSEFRSMVVSHASLASICSYINGEITYVLNKHEALSWEDAREILWLTIIKHSYYYWSTK